MRKLILAVSLLALAACAPPDDNKVIVGTVLQTLTSKDVTATLTRDGTLYRVYLQGKDAPLAKMFYTRQDRVLKITWEEAGTVWVHGVCGGEMHYPRGTGNGYPAPDAEHTVGIGFRCD